MQETTLPPQPFCSDEKEPWPTPSKICSIKIGIERLCVSAHPTEWTFSYIPYLTLRFQQAGGILCDDLKVHQYQGHRFSKRIFQWTPIWLPCHCDGWQAFNGKILKQSMVSAYVTSIIVEANSECGSVLPNPLNMVTRIIRCWRLAASCFAVWGHCIITSFERMCWSLGWFDVVY